MPTYSSCLDRILKQYSNNSIVSKLDNSDIVYISYALYWWSILWTLINLINTQYVYPYEDIYKYKLNVTNEYTHIYKIEYCIQLLTTYIVRQCTCMYQYVFTPARRNVRWNNYDHWRHKLGMKSEFNLTLGLPRWGKFWPHF